MSWHIDLDPVPSVLRESADAFGNLETRLEYDSPHERLCVISKSTVEVRSPVPCAAADTMPWPAVREQLRFSGRRMSTEHFDAARFRMESAYVKLKHVFADYAADCFADHRPILAGSLDLMHKIHRDFTYAPGATHIRTSAVEAFAARRGVCQDFAHIMLACLRSRGLAARYVSGYLHTHAPAGADPSWVGADASHAWISVFCPPVGWVDLDPTNDVQTDTAHIVVAWGRDFGDVSPLRGIIVGGGRHRLAVGVSVRPVEERA
jgi:transglutaminase-like putative cysteine protease